LQNPLQALLDLPEAEKRERGLEHTPGEIQQQPATWTKTYERCRARSAELQALLRGAGVGKAAFMAGPSSPNTALTVYLVGAGTSDYAGRALAPLLRRQWGSDVWAIPSTTMLTDFNDFHLAGRQYLWISFSRSGDSPEGVALLERALAQNPEIRHVVITCNARGRMAQLCARHADRALALVLDDAVNDRGLAMTSSFSNMLLAGQFVAHGEQPEAFGEMVRQMSETGAQFLPAAAEVAAAVTTLGCSRACFVGSGALRAVADESALKVVELSAGRVTTLAETPLGLRHGPMSSVDAQTLLVAYLSSEPRRRGYELDLLREIERKRLGRVRVAVTVQGVDDVSPLVDYCLALDCAPDFPDLYRPGLDVMLGQLIGLFASVRCGLKPDQPSPNGAITRVVQPIKLYS
jgi:tagatose-6-phosphate ketose/aldose isomerase